MKSLRTKRGFTIVELLAVIAIIGILAAVVLASGSEARKNTRDKVRMADIEQLALTMKLYVEKFGPMVSCQTGLKIDGNTTYSTLAPVGYNDCPDAAQILTFIEQQMGGVPHDPIGPGSNDYYYYFESGRVCLTNAGLDSAVLFAVNLESAATNESEVCPATVAGSDGGYIATASYGGTITASQPYVKRLNFVVHAP